MEGKRTRRRTGVLRDLLWILLPIVALLVVGASLDLFEEPLDLMHLHLGGSEDEIVFALLLAMAGLLLFSVQRWSTERHEAAARIETEAKHRALVEQMPAVLYTRDPREPVGTHALPYVSPQVERLLGFSPEEWTQDPELWVRQLHPEDRDRVLLALARADRTGEPIEIEYRQVRRDGSIVWVRDESVVVERDELDRPSLIQGILLDVTERRQAEDVLRETEARYRALVEQVPAVTYTWDPAAPPGSVAAPYVSPQVEHLLGFAWDEWQADPDLWHARVHVEDRERVLEEWDLAIRTRGAFRSEYRITARDGHLVWIRDEAVPVSSETASHRLYQGVMYDITERKLAEQQLVEAQGQFQTLVEQIPAIVYMEEPQGGRSLYISPQVEQMFGYTPAEWMSDPSLWEQRLHPDDRARVMAQNPADLGDRWSVEYRTVHRDGRVLWIQNEAVLIRDQEGRPLFWQGVAFDVTERKVAEERLRQAEEQYRTLVEQLPVVVYQDALDEVSTALYVSPQYERMFGFPPEARLHDPEFWVQHLHPDDRGWVIEQSRRANETGEPFIADYRFLAKDGRIVWVRDEAVLLRDDQGAPMLWQGVLSDITERKVVEEALSRRDAVLEAVGYAAERFLRAPQPDDVLPDVLGHLGLAAEVSRVYVFANETLDGGATAMSLTHEWLAPGVGSIGDASSQREPYANGFARWEAALSSRTPIVGIVREFPQTERGSLEAEGVRSLVVVPVFVGDDWWGFLGLDDCAAERGWATAEVEALKAAADTLGAAIGRSRAEQGRAETELRLRTLVETISAVTYIDRVDQLATTLYVSPQVTSMLGYTPEEWVEDETLWIRALHPDDRDRILEEVDRHNTQGVPLDVEYRFLAGDGTWRWIRDQATIVRDETGTPLASQGLMSDITALKETEEQLRETEAKYRALVEHIPAVLYVDPADEDGRSIYVSPQVHDVLGVSQQTYLDDADLWIRLIHPDDRPAVLEAYRDSLRDRQGWSIEYRVVRPDTNELVWIRDESAFLPGENGTPNLVQGVMFDVTERKLAEQALRDSERREREAAERLRALDEMKNAFLAAVSHELRSPLTSILGLAITLEQTRLPEEDRSDLLGRLATNARKLDRLLKDLLDIDRLNRGIVTPTYHPTDVGALVRRTVEALELIGERRILVEAEPAMVSVDPAKVERIVENLVANAARHTSADAGIWVRVWQENDGVVIAVEDEGPGVPRELRRAIFEPFRQGPIASPHSPGTGIGLSLVALFAELHGGRAWVQDRDGGGASFRVFLPNDPAPSTSSAVRLDDAGSRIAEAG